MLRIAVAPNPQGPPDPVVPRVVLRDWSCDESFDSVQTRKKDWTMKILILCLFLASCNRPQPGDIVGPCLPDGTCHANMVCTYCAQGFDQKIYQCYPKAHD